MVVEQRRREQRRRTAIVAGVVLAVVAVLVVAVVLGSRSDTSGEATSTTPSGVDDYTVSVGDADAPTTIAVYEDPQWPVCRDFEAQVGDEVTEMHRILFENQHPREAPDPRTVSSSTGRSRRAPRRRRCGR